jgi:hypothetical protein
MGLNIVDINMVNKYPFLFNKSLNNWDHLDIVIHQSISLLLIMMSSSNFIYSQAIAIS